MSRFLILTSAKLCTINPTYPISYVTGVEFESRSSQFSGRKTQDQWRLFIFNGREKEEFVLTEQKLSEIYLRQNYRPFRAGIRVLSPSRIHSLFYPCIKIDPYHQPNSSPIPTKKLSARILKFTMSAHTDLSYKTFPDTALVTHILPATSLTGKARVSYYWNGLLNEKYYTKAEYFQWRNSNIRIFFV